MDLGLRDRVFIITGGTSGLGLATARCLIDEGARVVVSGRSDTRIAEARSILDPEQSVLISADNAAEDTGAKLVRSAREAFSRLDGALISVGGPASGSAMTTTDADWRGSFETVFLGAVRMVREIAGAMDEGGGIGLVLSVSAKAPLQQMAVSNGLRPGLAALTKTFATELAARSIRVNALLPGPFETDRAKALRAAGTPSDVTTIPLGRLGQPDEFGRSAAFLLSPAASFVTGTTLLIDGGISPVP